MKKVFIPLISFLLLTALPSLAQDQKLNYYTLGEGLSFSQDKVYRINLRGYLQPQYEFKKFTDADIEGPQQRFRIRRLRMRLSGEAAQQKIEYRFQLEFSGNSETGDEANGLLLDAWVAYNITSDIRLTIGQKTTPTDNRELTIGSQTLQLPERSRVTSSFASIREFGIYADGNFRTGGGTYLRPTLAITNGDGMNVFAADHGGLKLGGRIDFLPFGLFTNYGQFREADIVRELTPKLVIGATYSHNKGMSSRRGRESGSILYLNDSGEESLPNYTKYGLDLMFKYKGFSLLSEFVGSSATVPDDITQRIRTDGSIATTFEIDGEQNVANYIKNRMMLGKGYNIQAGYVFKKLFSIDARYCHLDADQYSFLNNGTFYNRPNYYTLGLTKYFYRGYGFKVQASMTYVEAAPGSNDNTGSPMRGNEWIGRMVTTLSF